MSIKKYVVGHLNKTQSIGIKLIQLLHQGGKIQKQSFKRLKSHEFMCIKTLRFLENNVDQNTSHITNYRISFWNTINKKQTKNTRKTISHRSYQDTMFPLELQQL